jgi:hypothetical protein
MCAGYLNPMERHMDNLRILIGSWLHTLASWIDEGVGEAEIVWRRKREHEVSSG